MTKRLGKIAVSGWTLVTTRHGLLSDVIKEKTKNILMVAGEASGDLHGSNLIKKMKLLDPDMDFQGIGGPLMEKAGMDILIKSSDIAVVGLTEVFKKLGTIVRARSLMKKILKEKHPDLLILIDYPDFNINLASLAKKYKVPVLYYISPQIWAWRKGRKKKIADRVDRMAVILPFEKDIYANTGLRVDFVGHPLLDSVPDNIDRERIKNEISLENTNPVIGLLPGSRKDEIKRLLPVMLESIETLSSEFPTLGCILPVAPTISNDFIRNIIEKSPIPVILTRDAIYQTLAICDFAIVASGTATLETAILNVPMVVVYRVSPISYWIGRLAVDIPYIGLVNLIAGEEIVKELIQGKSTPQRIAEEAISLIKDRNRRNEMIMKLHRIKKILGENGASERTAKIALEMMTS